MNGNKDMTQNDILVSVVVPIYNVEKYLKKCLEQLAKQSLKEIEIIMVDDGSTDGSAEIAKKYTEKFKNFILVQKRNGGLSSARNYGMNYANGKYLYFCDSDDFILDNTLELLVTKAEADDLDVIKFCAYEFDDCDDNLRVASYVYQGDYCEVKSGKQLLQEMLGNGDNIPSACLVFVKYSLIKDNDIKFIEGIIHEDNFFHFQLMYYAQRVEVWKKELYCRRYRSGSITQNINYYKSFEGLARTAIELDILMKKQADNAEPFIEQYIYNLVLAAISQLKHLGKLQTSKVDTNVIINLKKLIVKKLFWGKIGFIVFTISIRIYMFMNILFGLKR